METVGFLFDAALTKPIVTVLAGIYHGLLLLHVPYPLGFSLILLTVVMRIVLYPLTHSQLKASKQMQTVAPHLSRLKDKHKNDSKKLQTETMKLYKEHGINPAAGCLPLIIQLPIIWALYDAFQKIVNMSPDAAMRFVNNEVYISTFKLTMPWDLSFFGIPLGLSPSALLQTMPYLLLIPVITGVLQFIQSKMMILPKDPNEKKKSDDFATAFQTQSTYLFPFMIALFSYQLPVGLSLYWNTFTIFGILQQYQLQGWGGMKFWPSKSLIKNKK